MNQIFGLCNLSLVPMRAEPSDRSEMVSQLLFGDHFEVLEETDRWIRIKTGYDDYEGWIDSKQSCTIDAETYTAVDAESTLLGLKIHHPIRNTVTDEVTNIVAGSTLPGYSDGRFRIANTVYSVVHPPLKPKQDLFLTEVANAARFYLNAPYLWGGRSAFGIDCSGLSQMVFKQFNIKLKRDAKLQALQGENVDFLEGARAGDLAFFDNEEGKITHVGIMLSNNRIIHASGRVKIDVIDTEGIYSTELRRYTHKLRIIKRFA